MTLLHPKFNVDQPRFDQKTYWGRAQHFFVTTNPANLFATQKQLEEAKALLDRFRKGQVNNVSEDEIWQAKHLYDSAYHPDSGKNLYRGNSTKTTFPPGEKMFLPGRMSAQVPFNMVITGCMMTFYKSTPAVVFWQWFNQSFNALVNYTNRSGDSQISGKSFGR